MTHADFYRAVYRTLFLLNERHDLRVHEAPANDNRGWVA